MKSRRYTGTAIALHWLVAALIVGTFALGTYMEDLPFSPQMLKLYAWHKWAGVTILLLVLLRLVWRLGHRPPPLPATVPAWQRRASRQLHRLLYLLMIAIPLSGWLMSSASGVQTVYFGLLPIPDLLGKDEDLAEALRVTHLVLNYSLLVLVIVHVAAAVKHHVVDRDDVLERMLPRRLARTPEPQANQGNP